MSHPRKSANIWALLALASVGNKTMKGFLKTCQNCNKPMNGGLYRAAHVCPHCMFVHAGGKTSSRKVVSTTRPNQVTSTKVAAKPSAPNTVAPSKAAPSKVASTKATSKKAPDSKLAQTAKKAPTAAKAKRPIEVALTPSAVEKQTVLKSLGNIAGENTVDIQLDAAHFSGGKFIGSKSDTVKQAITQGKKEALAQIRATAKGLGANTVAAVAVKNALKLNGSKQAKITVTATGVALLAKAPGAPSAA